MKRTLHGLLFALIAIMMPVGAWAQDEIEVTCSHEGSEHTTTTDNGDGAHCFNSADGICSNCLDFIAEASITIAGTTTYYETLNEAIDAVKDCSDYESAVVTMEQDIDLDDTCLEIFSGVFTFDLNGKTLSGMLDNGTFCLSGGDVTITDSGEGGTVINENYISVSAWNCTLTIEGGVITGDSGVKMDESTVTINGGTITGGFCGVEMDNSTVIINGGTITGDFCGVKMDNSTVTVNGGTITGVQYDLSNFNYSTITLGLGEDGVGVTFPDGLTVDELGLNAILGEGAAYWQYGEMLTDIADDATEITGDVTVKANERDYMEGEW